MKPTVLELASDEKEWLDFLQYKSEKQHLGKREEEELRRFVDEKKYLPLCELWKNGSFPSQCPVKRIVNKEGTRKKRTVYSYCGEEGILLKFVAFQLFRYENVFSDNCYAFRRTCGVREAMEQILGNKKIRNSWCLKVDVSDYFNSINTDKLLQKLEFLKDSDIGLYRLFCRILQNKRVLFEGKLIEEEHGAMAGIPIAPFFANVYLSDGDRYFEKKGVLYFRYSDDILIFEESLDKLEERKEELYQILSDLDLGINAEKVKVSAPGEYWEYLGFGYRAGELDLSENTIRKAKARIKRKADALRRWQRKKGLTSEKAAIGLIHAMNRKFFGGNEGEEDLEKEFTWSRWFFPCLTTDKGLKEIDNYLQEYIRYAVTGRHYKGNFRISYQQLKAWGYRSLVHEFWKEKHESKYTLHF